MSSTGFVNTPTFTALLSDGIATDVSGTDPTKGMSLKEAKVVAMDYKKVQKITPRVGIQNMGSRTQASGKIKQYCEDNGITEPGDVAEAYSNLILEEIEGQEHLFNMPWWNLNIMLSGYDKSGKIRGYHIASKLSRDLEPLERDVRPNTLGCLVPDVEFKESTAALGMSISNNQNIENIEDRIIKAYEATIRKYREKDRIAGGQIYCEFITPDGTDMPSRKGLFIE